jgi:hypothetical protein
MKTLREQVLAAHIAGQIMGGLTRPSTDAAAAYYEDWRIKFDNFGWYTLSAVRRGELIFCDVFTMEIKKSVIEFRKRNRIPFWVTVTYSREGAPKTIKL